MISAGPSLPDRASGAWRYGDSSANSILVIENNAAIADMLYWALELEGYRAAEVKGGQAALDWLDNFFRTGRSPSLILLGVSTPWLYTKAFLHDLHEKWNNMPYKRPPIIILTTLPVEIDNVEHLVVQKPFHIRDLVAEIRQALAAQD